MQQPHLLLRIIGYELVPDDRLFLVRGVPSQALLTDAAIDFFLAATECRIISSIVSNVEYSTPVEVYWMRRANAGDEQVCIDTLTLSRRPLPLDSEKPIETGEIDKQVTKYNVDVQKRGDSPYDNVLLTGDESKPQYGFLTHPLHAQSSNVLPLRMEGVRADAERPKPFLPTVPSTQRQPDAMGQVVKNSLSNVGCTFQHRSPEAPPPVYAAAMHMPSAQLQNISYGHDDNVDALAEILKNVDPHVMENAAHRQQIMTQLESYSSSSSSGSGKADSSPKFVGGRQHANVDTAATTGWQCPQCTYYNENASLFCDMCHNEKF